MVGRPRSLGCSPCKKRKIKCDQVRPKCSACLRANLQCGEYPQPFAFEVQTIDTFKHKPKRTSKSEVRSRPVSDLPDGVKSNGPAGCNCTEHESQDSEESNRQDAGQTRAAQGSESDSQSLSPLSTSTGPLMTRPPPQPRVIQSPALARMAILGAMQKAYIPRLPPELAKSGPHFENGVAATGLWLTSSFSLMQSSESPVLQDSLLAMSIVFLSKSPDRPAGQSQMRKPYARPIYQRALRRLQFELINLDVARETKRLDACLLSSFACAWFEMLGESSLENMRTHMDGVGALLRQLDVSRIKSPTALAVLAEYRMTNIWACIQLRQSSFLCSEDWLYRSWGPNDNRPLSRMQILLDIAYRIPLAMEAYDKAIRGSPRGPTAELESSMREQLSTVTAILNGINIWAGYETFAGEQKSSIWNSEGPFTEYFAYSNMNDALSWSYYFAVKLVVLKLLIDMKKVLISRDVREIDILEEESSHHRSEVEAGMEAIFGSMEYFFEEEQGYAGLAVSMVPFLIAYRYTAEDICRTKDLGRMRQRLEWCGVLRQKYLKVGFPV